MIEFLQKTDRSFFLFLNELHVDFLDPVMYYMSETNPWIPFYLLLIYLLYQSFKKKIWIPLLFIALTITMADQLTSGWMKPHFKRPRPTHEQSIQEKVHTVNNYRGGNYGFASSHAANTFAIALFFIALMDNKKWRWLLLWAALVSYTRIYLGVHYPGDILVGGLLGALIGFLNGKLCRLTLRKVGLNV